jgi:hypothetical protein
VRNPKTWRRNGAHARLSRVHHASHARILVDEYGIARKAVEFWDEEAVQKIRDNLYRLLTVWPEPLRILVAPSDRDVALTFDETLRITVPPKQQRVRL